MSAGPQRDEPPPGGGDGVPGRSLVARLATSPTAAAALLVLLTLAAYANSLSAGLPLDSHLIIRADPRLREVSWGAVQEIFTRDYWWPSVPSSLYRPLTTLSYWFDYAVLGHETAPRGYHAVNLLLHLVNVLLVRRLARCIGASAPLAWLAAAIFAVHPLGVEAVTNVVGRADLLATLLILVSALAWLRANDPAENPAWPWPIVAGASALLAVLAKETGVMAGAAAGLLLLRHGALRRDPRAWRNLGWVFGPSVVLWLVARWLMRDQALPLPVPFTDNPIAHAAAGEGLMTALGAAGRYFGLFAWPAALSCDYSYPAIRLFGDGGWATIQPLIAAAGFGAAAYGVARYHARGPLAVSGLAWCLVMMLPTANVFVKIGSVFAERFFYLPMAGAALAAAVLLGLIRSAVVRGLLAAICLAALGGRTWLRTHDWRDDLTLWAAAARAQPESYKVHKGLAAALFAAESSEAAADRAIAAAERALEKLTSPPLPIARDDPATRVDLGLYYRVKGQFAAGRGARDEARRWFQRALAVLDDATRMNEWTDAEVRRRLLAAGHAPETIGFTGNAEAPVQRALVLLELGDLAGAEQSARDARRFAPGSTTALSLFARIDQANGNYEALAVRLLQIVLLDRQQENAWRDLARVYAHLGMHGAVRRENGAYGIDLGPPRMRAHVNTALADLVRAFRAARSRGDARLWAERAVTDYGCPPSLFAEEDAPR